MAVRPFVQSDEQIKAGAGNASQPVPAGAGESYIGREMMTKKNFCFAAVLVLIVAAAGAQQLTRFAVVDTSRVYNTFFRDSAAVRNYDAKKD